MPPLRERKSDLPMLIDHFLGVMAKELGEPKKKLSTSVEAELTNYNWPGNVREVRNVIERICILVENTTVNKVDLPKFAARDSDQEHVLSGDAGMMAFHGFSLKKAREEFERRFILINLEANDWNVSKTAEVIGIERSNLHRKLRAYNIDLKQLKG